MATWKAYALIGQGVVVSFGHNFQEAGDVSHDKVALLQSTSLAIFKLKPIIYLVLYCPS